MKIEVTNTELDLLINAVGSMWIHYVSSGLTDGAKSYDRLVTKLILEKEGYKGYKKMEGKR